MEKEWERPIMSNLSWENQLIRNWDFQGNDNWRIYYKPFHAESCAKVCKDKHGFKFATIELVAQPTEQELWCNDTEVEFLFTGFASFDGIRHLHLGSEQSEIFGYINYPNILMLIDILNCLRNLELEFCREPMWVKNEI